MRPLKWYKTSASTNKLSQKFAKQVSRVLCVASHQVKVLHRLHILWQTTIYRYSCWIKISTSKCDSQFFWLRTRYFWYRMINSLTRENVFPSLPLISKGCSNCKVRWFYLYHLRNFTRKILEGQ